MSLAAIIIATAGIINAIAGLIAVLQRRDTSRRLRSTAAMVIGRHQAINGTGQSGGNARPL